jgi:hypothetical protein
MDRHPGSSTPKNKFFAHLSRFLGQVKSVPHAFLGGEKKEAIDLTHPFATMGVNSPLTQSWKF